jgi:hypothetical protein
MSRRRASVLLLLGALTLVAACTSDGGDGDDEDLLPASSETSPTTAAPGDVQAAARLSVTYGGETATFDYGQSTAVPSTLRGPATNPVQLHAGPPDDPLREFVLSGVLDADEPVPTSDELVLALNVEVGGSAITLTSTDGSCTVSVEEHEDGRRIAGSFTCDTTYGDESLTASGTFSAV